RGLWDVFARFELASSMLALNYPPHFTFAIYRDVNPEAISQAFIAAFSGQPPIAIVFDRIAVFDAASPVV
ncbi:hypothetical protein, partial [Escherichia coli]|uniref:hypothetical protein n=1 Tax=Escherichia coli TaxID=562 RepID=UPI0019535195